MRVGVMGINHRLAGVRLRELIAKACQKYFGSNKIAHPRHSFVLLSTCNRTEVYFSSDDPAASHSYVLHLLREEVEENFEQKIYSFFGYDCFFHLARVTAGLDSAILAETEIQGQVRLSYENSANSSSLPGELHFIFQKSLQIAKQARNRFLPHIGDASLEHAIWHFCKGAGLVQPNILFVGASQVNQKNLWYFQKRRFGKLWIANRTDEKAYVLADDLGIDVLPWKQLHQWRFFDVVCCATKAPVHLLHPCEKAATKLYFDLAVPQNILPLRSLQHAIFDIDQLQNYVRQRQAHLEAAAESAYAGIAEATLYHMRSKQLRYERAMRKQVELVFAS